MEHPMKPTLLLMILVCGTGAAATEIADDGRLIPPAAPTRPLVRDGREVPLPAAPDWSGDLERRGWTRVGGCRW